MDGGTERSVPSDKYSRVVPRLYVELEVITQYAGCKKVHVNNVLARLVSHSMLLGSTSLGRLHAIRAYRALSFQAKPAVMVHCKYPVRSSGSKQCLHADRIAAYVSKCGANSPRTDVFEYPDLGMIL